MTKEKFDLDLTSYIGQWVAISDSKVISNDKDLKVVSADIRKRDDIPMLLFVEK